MALLLGQRLDLVGVFAGDAELQRVAHRRPVFQAGHAELQQRELRPYFINQPFAQGLAGLQVFAQHHELGEVGLRQLLVQRQVEARRTGAPVTNVVNHALTLGQQLLQTLGLLFGGAQ